MSRSRGSWLTHHRTGTYIHDVPERNEFLAAFAKQDILTNYTVTDGPLDTPCHIWNGAVASIGYAHITYKYLDYYGHRLAWIRANAREIPKGMWCLHICETPSCINPTHLYIGTPKDNTDDRDLGTERSHAMTTLYNCKTAKDGFRITKFDKDLNPTSSYILNSTNCECPQAHQKTCRHRKMLPHFIKDGHVDDGWLLDFDTQFWIEPPTCARVEEDDQTLNVPELVNDLAAVGITTVVIDEGGPRPVSASPSTQPSHYRRMR